MMRKYARVVEGVVFEIFTPPMKEDGTQWPMEESVTADLALGMVEITDLDPRPDQYWTFDGSTFAPPAPYVPSPEEVLASQSAKLQSLKAAADAQKSALSIRVSVLNDSVELEMATPEEVAELPIRTQQLKDWKIYAVYLGRVTTQEGWAANVVWPVQPSEGIDLTTSSVSGQTS